MIKQSEILTNAQIKGITDIGQLKALISQYEGELNRQLQNLQKYKNSEPELYAQGMKQFEYISGRRGFGGYGSSTSDIFGSTSQASQTGGIFSGGSDSGSVSTYDLHAKASDINEIRRDVKKLQRRLSKLASALRSGKTNIRGLRKIKKSTLRAQAKSMKETINRMYGKRLVTMKSIMSWDSATWAKIRKLLEKFEQYYFDSSEIIIKLVENEYDYRKTKKELLRILRGDKVAEIESEMEF